jgi:hypothetical protein
MSQRPATHAAPAGQLFAPCWLGAQSGSGAPQPQSQTAPSSYAAGSHSQVGAAHWPTSSAHASPAPHVPHVPPQPSSPQVLPAQSGVHAWHTVA